MPDHRSLSLLLTTLKMQRCLARFLLVISVLARVKVLAMVDNSWEENPTVYDVLPSSTWEELPFPENNTFVCPHDSTRMCCASLVNCLRDACGRNVFGRSRDYLKGPVTIWLLPGQHRIPVYLNARGKGPYKRDIGRCSYAYLFSNCGPDLKVIGRTGSEVVVEGHHANTSVIVDDLHDGLFNRQPKPLWAGNFEVSTVLAFKDIIGNVTLDGIKFRSEILTRRHYVFLVDCVYEAFKLVRCNFDSLPENVGALYSDGDAYVVQVEDCNFDVLMREDRIRLPSLFVNSNRRESDSPTCLSKFLKDSRSVYIKSSSFHARRLTRESKIRQRGPVNQPHR